MIEFNDNSPLDELEKEEYNNIALKYCSFICILTNKKMNFPSIFVQIMETPQYFDMYKKVCGFENDVDAVREFLYLDESIVKSKFLKKIINRK